MNIPFFLALFAAVCAFIYFLYYQGFAVLRRTAAVMLIFRRGKNTEKAAVDSCTGWIKHAGRFREGKAYEFFLETQLSKGNVEVTLLDRKKQSFMTLTPHSPTYKITLDAGNRYYLRWDFYDATGQYKLRW